MIRLGRLAGTIAPEAVHLANLQAEFRERQCVGLPGLLSPELSSLVLERLTTARFSPLEHDGIGSELCMEDNALLAALHLACNDGPFLRLVESIASCAPLGAFGGRVYRMVPGAGHSDSWHDDLRENRQIGMSVNLSSGPYEGGLFQLRNRNTRRMLCEVHNIGLGDAIVFRLAPSLEHQVTPVLGGVPKTAFAGWFRPGPGYWETIRATGAASRAT